MQTSLMNNMSKNNKYSCLTVNELKAICKKREIKGHYKLNKSELVSKLLELDNYSLKQIDDFEFQPIIKKSKYKILNKLIESKKLIILSKIKDINGNFILHNADTGFVFLNTEERKNKPENYIVIGFLDSKLHVLPLTKEQILICKEWNFDYNMPENISEKDDETFENDELNYITAKINNQDTINEDDDEHDYDDIPNYEELLI